MAKNNKIPRCPFCGSMGHELWCNYGSKVPAEQIRDQEQRAQLEKKKFQNERVYRKIHKKDE